LKGGVYDLNDEIKLEIHDVYRHVKIYFDKREIELLIVELQKLKGELK